MASKQKVRIYTKCRDMTRAQFLAACKRNNFSWNGGWLIDEEAGGSRWYGGCYHNGKLNRRVTLAEGIHSRKQARPSPEAPR